MVYELPHRKKKEKILPKPNLQRKHQPKVQNRRIMTKKLKENLRLPQKKNPEPESKENHQIEVFIMKKILNLNSNLELQFEVRLFKDRFRNKQLLKKGRFRHKEFEFRDLESRLKLIQDIKGL